MVAGSFVAVVGSRFAGSILLSGLSVSASLAEPERFSWFETGLVVTCVLASAALFFWRFGPILRTIVHSKKDADFSLHPIGRRVWDFVWEVLCQAKVIKQRPLPGLAHAFVFWGFLAFALVSLNHLATGIGLGFLPPASYVGGFYFLFAAAWALLVAVSISALFIRPFFVDGGGPAVKALWGTHTLALLVFLPLIPHTKHLHLILSPLPIRLKPDG